MGLDRTVKKNFIIDTVFALIVILLILLFSVVLFKYLFPFVIGVIIALAVQKPALFLSRKTPFKSGKIAAVLSIFVFVALGVVVCFLVYRLAHFLIGLSEFLPTFFEKANEVIDNIGSKYSGVFQYFSKNFNISAEELIENSLEKFVNAFGNMLSSFAKGFVKNAPSFFISSIVTLVATCYISKDFLALKKFMKLFVGKNISAKVIKIKNILVGSVFKLLKGYLILSLIVFAILYVGLLILNVKNAVSIAFIIALADMLPVLGTGTAMIPWAVISALQGNYYFGIALAVLFITIVLVRNFLEPKIIGKQIGINSLFTLVAMFLGLKLFGVVGLILFPIILIVVIKYYKSEIEEELSH